LLCFLDHTIHLCEEVLQKTLRRLEGVRDAFVAGASVPMVAGQSLPGDLELLRGLHGVCVVVAEDPYSTPIMRLEAVFDAMKSMRRRWNPPCFDLDPATAVLLQNAAVQLKKRHEANTRAVH